MNNNKVIVVFGGGISRGGKLGWQSSVFGQPADFSISGSYVRVRAAALMWQHDQSTVVVTSGGRAETDSALPPGFSLSKIIKVELVAEGVATESIMEENQSGNTYQQLRAVADMAIRFGWSEVSVISNRFHLARIKAMVECLSDLKKLKPLTKYVSAEEVVLKTEPEKWRKQIKEAYASPEFAAIIEKEKQGVEQIKKGTYHYE